MTDSMTILLGGTTLSARYSDGTSEPVTLRQLPIKSFKPYLETLDDEPKRLELIAGQSDGWANRLTVESHTELLAAGEALNESNFFAWLRRRVKRQETFAPGSSGELGKLMLSASPTGSQSLLCAAV